MCGGQLLEWDKELSGCSHCLGARRSAPAVTVLLNRYFHRGHGTQRGVRLTMFAQNLLGLVEEGSCAPIF
jgi:hypothetical protein